MDSDLALVEPSDLPPDVLAVISGRLQSPIDLIRFRWVAQSWRFSIPPPVNKLSPFFPLTLSSPSNLTIHASAIFLLRSRSDPSKAWLASVQEYAPGKLLARHALTYELSGCYFPDLSSEYWSSATQIARSYAVHHLCQHCGRTSYTDNLALASNSPGCRSNKFFGLRAYVGDSTVRLSGFHLAARGGELKIRSSKAVNCGDNCKIEDFAKFNGPIYAVNKTGHVYVCGSADFKLHRICYGELWSLLYGANQLRFVVSDGDLYVVSVWNDDSSKCRVYRLAVDNVDVIIRRNKRRALLFRLAMDDLNENNRKIWEWEEVEDLGERVFFVARTYSFSVSARDLDHPWKGNCIVLVDITCPEWHSCFCYVNVKTQRMMVFHLGGDGDNQRAEFMPISSFHGYADLFAPPESWLV